MKGFPCPRRVRYVAWGAQQGRSASSEVRDSGTTICVIRRIGGWKSHPGFHRVRSCGTSITREFAAAQYGRYVRLETWASEDSGFLSEVDGTESRSDGEKATKHGCEDRASPDPGTTLVVVASRRWRAGSTPPLAGRAGRFLGARRGRAIGLVATRHRRTARVVAAFLRDGSGILHGSPLAASTAWRP